jgi:hypothetical protein
MSLAFTVPDHLALRLADPKRLRDLHLRICVVSMPYKCSMMQGLKGPSRAPGNEVSILLKTGDNTARDVQT